MKASIYILGILFLLVNSAFAKEAPTPLSMAKYMSSARSAASYAMLIPNQEQRDYFLGLIKSGKIPKTTFAYIKIDAKNLYLEGTWGKIKIDLAQSNQKNIWIDNVSYPIKNYYELGDFDKKTGAFYNLIVPQAQAADSVTGFFKGIAASIYSRWSDTSEDIISNFNIKELNCKNGKLNSLKLFEDEDTITYDFNRDKNGNIASLKFQTSRFTDYSCTYITDKYGGITEIKFADPQLHDVNYCKVQFGTVIKGERLSLENIFGVPACQTHNLKDLEECCENELCQQRVKKKSATLTNLKVKEIQNPKSGTR